VVLVVGATLTWAFRTVSPDTGRSAAVTDIVLTDFSGSRFTLADYEGKPLVVNFWASWCPTCTAEMPAFERVYQGFDGRVEFIGINNNDQRSAAEELARSVGVTYRLAEDPEGEAFTAFGGTGMPTTILIDAEGRVAETVAGGLTEEQLRSLIAQHLGLR
jgi:thiol-disulfide isomerase/thioredoxin